MSLTEQEVIIDFPEVQIPKDLKFPPNASYCTVLFSVSLFDMENNELKGQDVQSFEIEIQSKLFTVPAQQLNFEGSAGSLCVVALALYYSEKTFAGKAIINNKELCPAAVLRAEFCPGEVVKKDGWIEMEFNKKKQRKNMKKEKSSWQEVKKEMKTMSLYHPMIRLIVFSVFLIF